MTEQEEKPDDAQPELNDPINSISDLIARLQRFTGDDKEDQELVESLKTFGWLDHPAIHDENGLVIGGTRREAAAKRAGAKPPEPIVREYGTGPEADRNRIRDFLIDNAASKPFSLEDRKVIARFLKLANYSYREIGELLKVSERQAWQDVKHTSGSSPDATVPDKRVKMNEPMKQFATLLIHERDAVLRRLGMTKAKEAGTFKEIARRVSNEYKATISEQTIRLLAESLKRQAAREQQAALARAAPAQSVTEPAAADPAAAEPAAPEESGKSEESASQESESEESGSAEQPAESESVQNGHDTQSEYSTPTASRSREPTQLYNRRVPTKYASEVTRIAAVWEFMAFVDVTLEMLEAQAESNADGSQKQ